MYLFSLWETIQTFVWSIFGLIDLDNFELTGIKEFTRFFGLLMFGSFSVINIIVLLNLLIAMMNHSYQLISVSSVRQQDVSTNRKYLLHRVFYDITGLMIIWEESLFAKGICGTATDMKGSKIVTMWSCEMVVSFDTVNSLMSIQYVIKYPFQEHYEKCQFCWHFLKRLCHSFFFFWLWKYLRWKLWIDKSCRQNPFGSWNLECEC